MKVFQNFSGGDNHGSPFDAGNQIRAPSRSKSWLRACPHNHPIAPQSYLPHPFHSLSTHTLNSSRNPPLHHPTPWATLIPPNPHPLPQSSPSPNEMHILKPITNIGSTFYFIVIMFALSVTVYEIFTFRICLTLTFTMDPGQMLIRKSIANIWFSISW